MKVCSTCKESKSLDLFYKNRSNLDKLSYSCKTCDNLKSKNYKIKNREKILKRRKLYRIKPYNKEYNTHYLKKYNINIYEYNLLLSSQNNICKICQKTEKENKKKLSVDHCHKTGKVRGLLCDTCNRGLGFFKDNTDYLLQAIKYLSGENK